MYKELFTGINKHLKEEEAQITHKTYLKSAQLSS